jgi:hypothetical protein
MRRDHEATLTGALDQLYLQGSAAILREHLYLWYNADRLSKGVFNDIIARWQILCEGYGYSEDKIPELEEIHSGDTWLLLCRALFEDENRTPLADRT